MQSCNRDAAGLPTNATDAADAPRYALAATADSDSHTHDYSYTLTTPYPQKRVCATPPNASHSSPRLYVYMIAVPGLPGGFGLLLFFSFYFLLLSTCCPPCAIRAASWVLLVAVSPSPYILHTIIMYLDMYTPRHANQ